MLPGIRCKHQDSQSKLPLTRLGLGGREFRKEGTDDWATISDFRNPGTKVQILQLRLLGALSTKGDCNTLYPDTPGTAPNSGARNRSVMEAIRCTVISERYKLQYQNLRAQYEVRPVCISA
eukprot:2729600-Rhodomonas_salina.2